MLTNTLEVHATIKDDEIFEKTIRSINELNDRYNELVMIRQTSAEENEQAPDDLATEITNN